MNSWLVGAALTSALLHAGWNASVKASLRPAEAMTAQMLGSAVLALPLLFWAGLPASTAWPWMAASTLLNIGAIASLLRAYRHGGFGVVYPMARASSVLLVLPLAAAAAGEWPRPLGVAGVALVSSAVAVLALGRGEARAMSRPALLWTLAAAAFTAGYIVCDGQGVRRSQSPLAYGCAMAIVNGVLWAGLQQHSGMKLRSLSSQWPRVLPVALAAMLSYLLILWVWTLAPIALGSALRDTSAVFATLIAVAVLKEPLHRSALVAVALATVGSMLIRLG
jgi:drug/metabolite transporter (DMT)-like permease